jgi:8-oxo-dGTP pyrophosphatase MutT (NUDIX family)
MNIELLKQKLAQSRPGIKSHLKMAPEHRADELMAVRDKDFNPKLSAVLVILFHENERLKIVFIRRSEYVGIHSGQIAFPGGRYEESDADLRVTAIREVREEIGVPDDYLEILGSLSDLYVPPSNFLVRAYVAYAHQPPVYQKDDREVQEIIEFNLEDFYQKDIIGRKDFQAHNSLKVTNAPYYEINGVIIWGATAMMMAELLEILS